MLSILRCIRATFPKGNGHIPVYESLQMTKVLAFMTESPKDAESLLLLIPGAIAALADVAGGLVLVRARGVERYLRYFVALGAGFLMATALIEMAPEGLKLNPHLGPVLIMAGYCAVHLLEHTINAHFHYGEETHHGEFMSARKGYAVLGGLSVHALFDGVAIGSGFAISGGLGWLIFLAILLHKGAGGIHDGVGDAGQRAEPLHGFLLRCRCWRPRLWLACC